jgi:glycosyltransferase involved in cell wall biosynthesis
MSSTNFQVFLGTYNASPWIENLVHALEKQTCDPFTVNIIDNASTDDTLELIENLFATFQMRNNYKLVKSSLNIGPISTFMDRLELFDTDWIFMVHQDDYYHPDHFQVLIDGINEAKETTGIVFTAMQRMNENSVEIFSTPTLSSKLSEQNRLENFLLTLQINPVNFPSCALRKSLLQKVNTTRHTTAFNDTEMLLRMMCISDVKYLPVETMHYRIHSGNADKVTDPFANSYAVVNGFIQLFESSEFAELLENISLDADFDNLVLAINSALDIRITDLHLRNLLRGILAESLIRKTGYTNSAFVSLLKEAHVALSLNAELKVIENLSKDTSYTSNNLTESSNQNLNYAELSLEQIQKKNLNIGISINHIPLKLRERTYSLILKGPWLGLAKRPFIRVWRFRGKS